MAKMAKWKPIYIIHVYRMVKQDLPDTDIAKSLKVSRQTYYRWMEEHPELKQAVEMGEKERKCKDNWREWIYTRLSPELRKVWDRIRAWEIQPNGVAKIELILEEHGLRVRQELFLHALCVSRFSPSVAMARVNVSKREFDRWLNTDPDFAALVEEIQWHKGNFFEDSLVSLVDEGNPAAVLFANKTFNASRGYANRSQVDVNVQGKMLVGVMDLDKLVPYLSETARFELLEAMRLSEKAELESKVKESLSYEQTLSNTIAGSIANVVP